jgi:hypothetical protein
MKKVGTIAQSPADGVSIPTIPEGEAKHLEQHQIDALFEALRGRGNTEARDTVIVFSRLSNLWMLLNSSPECSVRMTPIRGKKHPCTSLIG